MKKSLDMGPTFSTLVHMSKQPNHKEQDMTTGPNYLDFEAIHNLFHGEIKADPEPDPEPDPDFHHEDRVNWEDEA